MESFRDLSRLKKDGLDLVWFQYSNLPDLFFIPHIRSLGLPLLVTPHLGRASRTQRYGLFRAFSKKILEQADGFAMLYPDHDREVALPEKIPQRAIRTFLPGSILETDLPQPTHGQVLRLMHASRLSEQKGSFRFLDLCAELKRREIPFSARLVGRGDSGVLRRLNRQIENDALEDCVTFEGWQSEDAIASLLRESDVLVHLSTLDTFPLIVLEALASGVVPIVYDIPGVVSMLSGKTGKILRATDPVTRAADWLEEQSPVALRTAGLKSAQAVRRDYAWETCVRILSSQFDATLATAAMHRPA
ncbi:glycosyltransferase family 4 protein [Stakelama tenebrarum]|uniref:Glycosyltransferase n=1 Tax=Stakelama tenebrarum TaxID=2711215 RepID=A0A6G6Y3M0_9SPHN|nr:glycosyltransferase [Sphingosinithalassobacter tenebrarum]QIG79544.1 glycosyltransferase [Sphingosinithalassobacter tenebrarum]